MASSSFSISSIKKTFKYDVFLSFRGEDTRKNFVDHLYAALQSQAIDTFKDDERIKQGKRINNELIASIEDSNFFIIVFSKNYASSSWCLDELVKIMECHKTMQQTAYPVFYDVEPSEVRKQHGKFGEGFSKYKNEESAGKWRKALEEAANLAGWELKNFANGHEAKLIQKIVEEISLELRSINSGVDEKLVGIESRMKHVASIVESSSDEVHMIGIKGMGGGGKTTLARAVFDKICNRFDGNSFVENVREVSKNSLLGLKVLQKQVLSDVLTDQNIIVNSVSQGKNLMKRRLCGKRVLVVLDDVDHIDQLEALAGAPSWFKPGSIFIITTRDEQVLVAHGVNWICDISLLSDDEAISLFSRYAFGREIPVEGYEELSAKVIRYAGGLPLTIKVLGSLLCGKDKLEWIDALERLKTIPLQETLEKLELSYNCLEKDYKEIFLDVACFLKGWQKERAIMLLESCGFHARHGLRILEQKSLITINNYGVLGMHDHIQEMGMNIVCREHLDEPGKRTRLWIQHEIEDVLARNLGTKATRCIKMELNYELVMEGLGNMKNLRCLIVESNFTVGDICRYFPSELQYLSWERYPNQSLPKNFGMNNLVGLQMIHSRINQLWGRGERKVLNKLKFINLYDLYNLRTLDFERTPNLEKLLLHGCYNLVQLHVPSFKLRSVELTKLNVRTIDLRRTPNLEKLDLRDCVNLVELHMPVESLKLWYLEVNPSKLTTLDLGRTPNLEKLVLKHCFDLVQLHMHVGCPRLESVNLSYSKLKTFDLGLTPNLVGLNLYNCHDLVQLHMHVGCPRLESVNLSYSKLKTFDLGLTPSLKKLVVERCYDLVELQMSSPCLNLKSLLVTESKLETLDLRQCPYLEKLVVKDCDDLVELHIPSPCLNLTSLELSCLGKLTTLDLGPTPNLEKLYLVDCVNLVELNMPVESLKLRSLEVCYSKLRTLDLGLTPNLKKLVLEICESLVDLQIPSPCSNLKSLILTYSKLRTLDLGLTPNLVDLNLYKCHDLVQLHMPVGFPKLKSVNLSYSKLKTFDLGLTPSLKKLVLQNCDGLVELQMPSTCPNLKSIEVTYSKFTTLDLGLTPNLKNLNISNCHDLVQLHMHGVCSRLEYVDLSHSKLKTFDLGLTPNLKKLVVKECDDLVQIHMPLKGCTTIYFSHSPLMVQKVEKSLLEGKRPLAIDGSNLEVLKIFDKLELVEELFLCYLKMKHLSGIIYMSKHLKSLQLDCVRLLEKLPEDLDQFECLEKLSLSNCNSLREIPNSICNMKHLKYFRLFNCIRVEKLPEQLGRLECLKELNVECTPITHLPQSISLLKGLRVVGSRSLLQSCHFATKIQTSETKNSCYIG